MIKAVTVFAGARDQYQIPIALAQANLLEALVTDVYFAADQVWFNKSLRKVIPDTVLAKRFRSELSSQLVRISWQSLGATIVNSLFPQIDVNRFKNRIMGAAAREYALRTESALLSYSYYAYSAFKPRYPNIPYKFLFQVHPHPSSVRQILQEELEITPHARDSLMQEYELQLSDKRFEQFSQEPLLANGWIVASSFTKQTLIENGIPKSGIHVVPYGVDTSAFVERAAKSTHKPFTILFVGQMVQRKGLSYLLDAMRLLSSRNIKLILCGRGFVDHELLDEYRDLNVDVQTNIPFDKLLNQLHNSHIFVLPSLVEGFGHVVIEAMATGLPVIVTPNTCGPDIITDGQEGFIVPIRSDEAIANKIVWAIDHPQELKQMGYRAALKAKQQTWEHFRQRIVVAYQEMVQSMVIENSTISYEK